MAKKNSPKAPRPIKPAPAPPLGIGGTIKRLKSEGMFAGSSAPDGPPPPPRYGPDGANKVKALGTNRR